MCLNAHSLRLGTGASVSCSAVAATGSGETAMAAGPYLGFARGGATLRCPM